MLPSLHLPLHDHVAETGPPVRGGQQTVRPSPYDRPPGRDAPEPSNEDAIRILEKELGRDLETALKELARFDGPDGEFLSEMSTVSKNYELLVGKDFFDLMEKHWKQMQRYGARELFRYFALVGQRDIRKALLEAAFPSGTTREISTAKDLFALREHLVYSMLMPDLLAIRDVVMRAPTGSYDLLDCNDMPQQPSTTLWTFSCHPEWTGGSIRMRHLSDIGSVNDLERFIQSNSSMAKACGTSNCTLKNVSLATDGPIRRLIADLNPTASLPDTVTVRAPSWLIKPESTAMKLGHVVNAMRKEVVELVFTLHMARLGLTPPILAVVPLRTRKALVWPDKVIGLRLWKVTQFGFAYVSEAGWTDLQDFLAGDKAVDSSPNRSRMQAAIVDCVRTASDAGMLLLDVKPTNMVVKAYPSYRGVQEESNYDVKMIDFDGQFTVNMSHDLYANQESFETSKDCIFFLNGLLLLNYAAARSYYRSHFFFELFVEVVATWRMIKNSGIVDGFCSFFQEDRVFAQKVQRPSGETVLHRGRNLTLVSGQESFKMEVYRTFYVVLEYYGIDVVDLKETKAPAERENVAFVEHILNKLTMKGRGWAIDQEVKQRIQARATELAERRFGSAHPGPDPAPTHTRTRPGPSPLPHTSSSASSAAVNAELSVGGPGTA